MATDESTALHELTEFMHGRNRFDYDECQHGTYSGGPSNGEPYAMCERQARGLIEAGYRNRRAKPAPPKLISEKISDIIKELEQLMADAEDIEFTGTQHKIEAALGDLKSAQLAAEQDTAAGKGF